MLLILIFWIKGYLVAGHFPYYGHPDPATIQFNLVMNMIVFMAMGLPLIVIGLIYFRKQFKWKQYVLFFLPLLLIWLLYLTNFLNIADWMMD
ncbi:MAG: putative integral membrane protein [Crocinitomicaceae bacterium]|jgi:uncharacterized integral membrane protein